MKCGDLQCHLEKQLEGAISDTLKHTLCSLGIETPISSLPNILKDERRRTVSDNTEYLVFLRRKWEERQMLRIKGSWLV